MSRLKYKNIKTNEVVFAERLNTSGNFDILTEYGFKSIEVNNNQFLISHINEYDLIIKQSVIDEIQFNSTYSPVKQLLKD